MASPNPPPEVGAASASADEALPIFEVLKVEMRFNVAADFVAAQVANNVLVLALPTGRIMRIDLEATSEVDDIDLPKKPQEVGIIKRLFLDPTASHLLVSTTLGENFYLHTQSRTPKQLSRLKGIFVETISWNPSQPTASTREILIGATDGTVYETYIENTTEFYRREEKYLKTVYKVEGPVSGIWTEIISTPAGSASDVRRLMVATPKSLYHFVGRLGRHGQEGSGSIFAKLFESETPTVRDVSASTKPTASALTVTPEMGEMSVVTSTSRPERIFAWLNADGIFHGKLLSSPVEQGLGKRVFDEAKTLDLAKLKSLTTTSEGSKSLVAPPSFIALTQWHMLLLTENRVVAINRLDNSVVHDQVVLDSGQKPIALLADLKGNTYWLFTSKDIFEISVRDEDRDVWKVLLKAGQFDSAFQHANNSVQRDAVSTAMGDSFLSRGKYMEAAETYGRSTKPFEQVALKFIDQGQRDALRRYLFTKLSATKKSATMQRIMLTSWLTEIFMAKLNSLDDMITTKAELTEEHETPEDVKAQRSAVKQEFQDFIRKYRSDIDRKTVYDIISSHGREEELLFLATTVNDNNFVLAYWVQREDWKEALRALNRQAEPEIIYKYSSVLMAHAAVEFVDIIMRQANLDPRRLIPAILNYNQVTTAPLERNQAVRYLLFEINHNGSEDSAVHNTLISIYAASSTRDETALLNYLESVTPSAGTTDPDETIRQLPYDADFALRLCTQHARVRACALIYCTMRQFLPAVELALEHDEIELAISIAERPENDAAAQRKLWISIARSIIIRPSSAPTLNSGASKQSQPKGLAHKQTKEQSASIKTALSLLDRAPPGILRIEDLLPLFPEFVLINDFKPAICAALESYSNQIAELKSEMDSSAKATTRLEEDAKQLDNRWVLLEPGESCAVCNEVLLDRRFWVWGCGHGVHSDCAVQEVEKRGAKVTSRRVKELRELLEGGVEGKRREEAMKQMDEIVGAECPKCGDMAVRSLDEEFVPSNALGVGGGQDWDL